MTKFLAASLTAALLVPTAAFANDAPAPKTFTRDGETYVYTLVDKGDRTVVTGRATPSGRNFHLNVRGNRVKGFSGGMPVSFTMPATAASSGVTTSR